MITLTVVKLREFDWNLCLINCYKSRFHVNLSAMNNIILFYLNISEDVSDSVPGRADQWVHGLCLCRDADLDDVRHEWLQPVDPGSGDRVKQSSVLERRYSDILARLFILYSVLIFSPVYTFCSSKACFSLTVRPYMNVYFIWSFYALLIKVTADDFFIICQLKTRF